MSPAQLFLHWYKSFRFFSFRISCISQHFSTFLIVLDSKWLAYLSFFATVTISCRTSTKVHQVPWGGKRLGKWWEMRCPWCFQPILDAMFCAMCGVHVFVYVCAGHVFCRVLALTQCAALFKNRFVCPWPKARKWLLSKARSLWSTERCGFERKSGSLQIENMKETKIIRKSSAGCSFCHLPNVRCFW